MGTLPTKVAHASQEVLAKKIQLQRKKIANQEQIIHTLQVQLQQKVEEEEEKISNELGQIAKETVLLKEKNKIIFFDTNILEKYENLEFRLELQCSLNGF
ncbi:unnamed protein product [Rhizophagus irregularis]|nr:unnamed protein product [Rhizophagus irregularis]